MGANGFFSILVGFILFSTFAFLVTFPIVQMGNNYGLSSDDVSSGALTSSDFEKSISDVNSSSETFRTRFESGDISNVDDVTGLFGIARDMVSMIITPFTLVASVLTMLNVPALLIGIIMGILSVGLILSIWRVLRVGD